MAKDDDTWYDSIIDGSGDSSMPLLGTETGETDDGGSPSDGGLTRRSYLASAGAAAAALAGCAGRAGQPVVTPVTVFGFGGGTAIRQSEEPSTSVAESEPNDTLGAATPVALGEQISGDLRPSDSDWYALELSNGQQLAVTFWRSSQTGVTAVIVYDADGVFSNLRYISTDETVAFEVTAETSGTHHVQVVDTQSSDGAYTLALGDASATETPDSDSGTETPTPTPIEDDYGQQGYGEYGYGGIKA
ncbi:carbohydrate binding module (family 6) protein [Halorubrum coriense DSM 10284]|uniref:Carbohydrate binding module (Family 6) protein n=1 Tax=Halorubrum coriense DSM 10284 TaxID=1227466 RepID=M0EGQ8_9EURY|nr:hypothetical protein [Halorubrum coriense]ELZ46961.1 carbohydrate binding module (family 6) protein [Halorubrum coriense DSM 10284]